MSYDHDPVINRKLAVPGTVRWFAESLAYLTERGMGDRPVYASIDDEGNGYHALDEIEIRDYTDEYLDEYGWDEDIDEGDVVVLW